MATGNRIVPTERFRVSSSEAAGKVREVLGQADVSRLVVCDAAGRTLMEVEVTPETAGEVVGPVSVAADAIAAVVGELEFVVEKTEELEPPAGSSGAGPKAQ